MLIKKHMILEFFFAYLYYFVCSFLQLDIYIVSFTGFHALSYSLNFDVDINADRILCLLNFQVKLDYVFIDVFIFSADF